MVHNRRRFGVFIGIMVGIFIASGAFLPSERLLELMRAAWLAVMAGMAHSYWYDAKSIFYFRRLSHYEFELAVTASGMTMIGASQAVWATWFLVWVNMGKPDLLWDDYLLALLSFIGVVGATIIIAVARANSEGYIPMKEWGTLGTRTAGAVALILAALAGLRAYVQGSWPF